MEHDFQHYLEHAKAARRSMRDAAMLWRKRKRKPSGIYDPAYWLESAIYWRDAYFKWTGFAVRLVERTLHPERTDL